MHTALFEHQEVLGDDHLVQHAADLDLDTARKGRGSFIQASRSNALVRDK
jgi:hypothetical protein